MEPPESWGTGFFVADCGLFLTAAHVFDGGPEPEAFFVPHFLEDGTLLQRPVARVYPHSRADIAVGLVKPMHHVETRERLWNPVVALTADVPSVGEVIFCFAYPLTTVVSNDQGLTAALLNPFWTDGVLEAHFPNGRDRVVHPAHCVQTSLTAYGGSSGAPVMDSSGRAFAVVVSSLEETPTYAVPVAEALTLEIPAIAFSNALDTIPRLADIVPFRGLAPKPPAVASEESG